MADAWHKVTKHFKGGSREYQIRVPDGVRLSKAEWEDVLEWIGEHTTGGHNYGYRIHSRKLRQKSATLKVLAYPGSLCASTIGKGEIVTTRTEVIK